MREVLCSRADPGISREKAEAVLLKLTSPTILQQTRVDL